MLRLPLHRISQILRLPAMALLVLAVLVTPVLAAVGDLHESSHAGVAHAQPADAHGHVDDGQGTPEPGTPDQGTPDEGTPDQGTPDQGTDLLHALLHAAHCCGHQTAILSALFVSSLPISAEALPVMSFADRHSPLHTDPFRPPIAI